MYAAWAKTGHTMNACDLDFQGRPLRWSYFFQHFWYLDLDTTIEFVSCLQQEIKKVMQKGVWSLFSRSCNEDTIFSLSLLDSLTLKTYPTPIRNIFEKFERKSQISGGQYPPLGVFGWRNTLGIWVFKHELYAQTVLVNCETCRSRPSRGFNHSMVQASVRILPVCHFADYPRPRIQP